MSEEIKNGNTHNIDGLLAETFNEQAPSFLDTSTEQLTPDAPESAPTQEVAHSAAESTINNEGEQQLTESPDVDEFGTEIKKPEKMYTQAEVEAMMRERLSRVKQQPQEQHQQQQPEQGVEGDWKQQLEEFNEAWYQKRTQREQEMQWRQQQQEVQANFEIKFNEGASRYDDFQQVVYGKPLTPEMVLATRGMSDPAAFIYAAAKTQSKELERISQIRDPMAQALEMGQLAERMRKARSSVSQAPRPIEQPSGDVVEKANQRRNIDDTLRIEEKRMRESKMRR